MASWNRPIITNRGVDILNDALNNKSIVISKIKFSNNRITDNIESLESIDSIKKEISPSSINKIDNVVQISAIFNNENNALGYNMETIGIYATVDNIEHLIAVITAIDSDFIPRDDGSGVITINFDFFININNNANISINYNSNSLLKQSDVNNIVGDLLKNKANKSEVISDIMVENRILKYIKNNIENNVSLGEEILDATDNIAGKISKNSIREIVNNTITSTVIKNKALEKIRDFGIGSNNISYIDINAYKESGIYVSNGNNKIDNVDTFLINYQYENKGFQIGMNYIDKSKLYIRSKNNNMWSEWLLLASINDVENNLETIKPIIESKIDNRNSTFEEIWSGI